jgi:hypothetical protein
MAFVSVNAAGLKSLDNQSQDAKGADFLQAEARVPEKPCVDTADDARCMEFLKIEDGVDPASIENRRESKRLMRAHWVSMLILVCLIAMIAILRPGSHTKGSLVHASAMSNMAASVAGTLLADNGTDKWTSAQGQYTEMKNHKNQTQTSAEFGHFAAFIPGARPKFQTAGTARYDGLSAEEWRSMILQEDRNNYYGSDPAERSYGTALESKTNVVDTSLQADGRNAGKSTRGSRPTMKSRLGAFLDQMSRRITLPQKTGEGEGREEYAREASLKDRRSMVLPEREYDVQGKVFR